MDARVAAPQVIGHEMSGTVAELGDGVEGFAVGDAVVVRPLDSRGRDAGRPWLQPHQPQPEVPRDRRAGSAAGVVDRPGLHVHALPAGVDLRLGALAEPLAVACHDVRRGQVAAGETAVVIGGGPIGLLIALVARAAARRCSSSSRTRAGARSRRSSASRCSTRRPTTSPRARGSRRTAPGADVVFEVSGSAEGILAATKHAAVRGRVVVVAIFPEPKPVALFDLFWKELEVLGARVYEPEDFDAAIELIGSGSLDLERLVTAVEPLERVPELFDELARRPASDEDPVDCRA